jgi:glycine cleavage system H lipoate-binding protein
MDLGVLTYKICSRDYRCEDCPLDIGLRGGDLNVSYPPAGCMKVGYQDEAIGATSFLIRQLHQTLLKRMIGPYFEHDRYYSPRHTWVRVVSNDRCVVGIDNMVAAILGVIDEVRLPLPGTMLYAGDALCEVRQLDQMYTIASPISGEVDHVNGELSDYPPRLLSDPMKGGWVCAINPTESKIDLKKCSQGVQALPWIVEEFLRIEKIVGAGLREKKTPLSNTMNDGGDICSNLEELLSKEDYIKLIDSLLN